MKRKIDVFDYTAQIIDGVKSGVLLTTKANEKVNSMAISWGMLGIEWNKPVFITFVREHRFTHEQLENNGEFTINIPIGSYDKKILGICGTKSGRDIDKVAAAGLTLEEPDTISVPGIKEFALTLECRVIYKQAQTPDTMTAENKENFHPQNVDSSNSGANKDYHTAYYGEIVSAYIIEE